jgi:hypothetical protein
LPGFPDIFANDFLFVSLFINDDFPTLERPIKAYSGLSGAGHFFTSLLLITKRASLISMKAIIYLI